MNGSELCKLLRRKPLKKELGGRWLRKNIVKKSYPEERKEPYIRESSHTK